MNENTHTGRAFAPGTPWTLFRFEAPEAGGAVAEPAADPYDAVIAEHAKRFEGSGDVDRDVPEDGYDQLIKAHTHGPGYAISDEELAGVEVVGGDPEPESVTPESQVEFDRAAIVEAGLAPPEMVAAHNADEGERLLRSELAAKGVPEHQHDQLLNQVAAVINAWREEPGWWPAYEAAIRESGGDKFAALMSSTVGPAIEAVLRREKAYGPGATHEDVTDLHAFLAPPIVDSRAVRPRYATYDQVSDAWYRAELRAARGGV